MIIDGLALVGSSINGYCLTSEELLTSMDTNGIDKCVIAPVQPKTYRLEPGNDAIAAAQGKYPGQLIGFCRVDPRQNENAVSELRRCVLQLGLKGLMLHPMEEGYRINAACVLRLLIEAGDLGVPVVVASGYPWMAHSLQVHSAAEQATDTTIIMTHGGQINISGLAQADAFLALQRCDNLYIGTNGVYRQDFIEECVAKLGPRRVLFASMTPLFDQGFELDRVCSIHMEETDRTLLLGENLACILNRGISA